MARAPQGSLQAAGASDQQEGQTPQAADSFPGPGRGAVERSNGAQPPVGACPGQDNRTAQAQPDGADPVSVHLRMPCHPPERGLQGGNAVVAEVSGHPADEHPGHARRAVAALEQVHSQRRVTFCGEPAADVADVVVEPGGLMDDDYTGIRRWTVRQRQIRGAEGFGSHRFSLARCRRRRPVHLSFQKRRWSRHPAARPRALSDQSPCRYPWVSDPVVRAGRCVLTRSSPAAGKGSRSRMSACAWPSRSPTARPSKPPAPPHGRAASHQGDDPGHQRQRADARHEHHVSRRRSPAPRAAP